jgi:hypothetical protein
VESSPPQPPEGSPPAEQPATESFPPLKPAIVFDESLLSRVAGFSCGDEEWEREVAQWIQLPRGSGGALDAIADQGTAVWLYETAAGNLVGYGSLGVSYWRHPNPKKSPQVPLLIIPFVGIRSEFQGKPPPPTPRTERYAWRIFEDLLAKALAHQPPHELLGLFVHKRNERAIAFYRRFGFIDFSTRGDYQSMLLELRQAPGATAAGSTGDGAH